MIALLDANGTEIKVGDIVRVTYYPDDNIREVSELGEVLVWFKPVNENRDLWEDPSLVEVVRRN